MLPSLTTWSFLSLAALGTVEAYFLMGANDITTERIDPIVNKGRIASHVHTVFGGSNFRMSTNTTFLRESECTSVPIVEDKSNYWVPTMYFQWKNGSVSSVNGGAVIYYLFDVKQGTKAFPDDFRMISGDPLLRTYDPTSYAQQAITFLCLDFNGVTTRHNELPKKTCPSGVRAQVNFPMCWDGKNVDSPDHKSHVAFPSGGPDTGGCSDPKFPVTLPRVFMEMYWGTADFKDHVQDAMNPEQPFVFANGDPTGYGYHGDYINGWKPDVLQRVVDECDCDPNGSLDCCAAKGIFTLDKDSKCRITKAIDEATQGTLPKLPGNNPIQAEGTRATSFPDTTNPNLLSPIYVYRGDTPDKVGTPSGSAASGGGTGVSSGSGSESGQSGSSGSDQTPPPTGGEQNGNSDQPPTSGTGSASSDGGQSLPTTLTSSAASPPPTSGSNNDNTGSGSNGNNQSNQSGQSLPVSPPTGSGSSGSSSGGTSNSSSQQGSTGGSGSKTCKSGVKKRSSKAKRHGNSVRRRFHASDF